MLHQPDDNFGILSILDYRKVRVSESRGSGKPFKPIMTGESDQTKFVRSSFTFRTMIINKAHVTSFFWG